MLPPRPASFVKIRPQKRTSPPQRQDGFTLVEVTVALGLTIFAVMAVVGLLPVGLGGAATSRR